MKTPALVALALALLPPAARAQAPLTIDRNFLAGQVDNLRMDDLRAAFLAAERGPALPGPRLAETTFLDSPDIALRARRRFADYVQSFSVAGTGERMMEQMREHDPIAEWLKVWGDDGLKPQDIIDAETSYWIINWGIANGAPDDTSAQTLGVRAQLAPVIARDPGIAGLDPASRQLFAQTLILNGIFQAEGFSAARQQHDTALLAKMASSSRSRFLKEANIDLTKIDLTERGFTVR